MTSHEERTRSSVLCEAVREVAARRGDACAVRTTRGEQATYSELMDLADRLAGSLADRGLAAGDAVACCLRNGIGYVALIMATARLGARYVPIMSDFDASTVRAALERTGPRLLVVDGHRETPRTDVATADIAELLTGEPLPVAPDGARYDGLFRTLWTSGSTGFPKLMAWRQDKFVTERRRWIADTGITADDVFFCRHTLDVAHATDLHVFAALLSGAELVLADPAAPADVLLSQLEEYGATAMSALPQHYADLVRAAEARAERVDLSRLRRPLCGGAYLSPAVMRRSAEVLGVRIRQIYGSTEFGLALGNMADTLQAETGMVPVKGVGVRLEPLDDTSPDTVGELVLISDCTSEGYLDAPEANARTFRGEEFWTNDVASLEEDGTYRILGRVTEALATPAGPVPAPVVDGEIHATGQVTHAVCLPLRPGEYGSEVFVALRPAPGHSEEEVAATASDVLLRHGLKGRVRVVEDIPLTPVGKVNKPLLARQWGVAEGTTR